jgi:hypothetical protein
MGDGGVLIYLLPSYEKQIQKITRILTPLSRTGHALFGAVPSKVLPAQGFESSRSTILAENGYC